MADPTAVRKLVLVWEADGSAPEGAAYGASYNQWLATAEEILNATNNNLTGALANAPSYPAAEQYLLQLSGYQAPYSDVPSRIGVDSTSTPTQPQQTAQSQSWIDNMNTQLAAAQLGYIRNTDTTVTALGVDGKTVTFPIDNNGNVDFTQPVSSMSEMDQLNLMYRKAQLAKLLGGDSGGGGRTQFESESRLQNAQAAKIEQEMSRLGMGGSRLVNIGGIMYDPDNAQAIDPSTYGVSRFNADTGRLGAMTERDLANFQMGPRFAEEQRQFNQRLGLDALAEERLGKSAAAQAEIGFGNLGIDRGKFISELLSRPSDALARLYMQRGGVSPTEKIEMADLLNSFNRQAQNISAATSRFMPSTQPTQLAQPPALAQLLQNPAPVSTTPTTAPTSRINSIGQVENYTPWGAQAAVEDDPSTPFDDPYVTSVVNDLNDAANSAGGWGSPGTDATEGIREIERAMGLAQGGFVKDSRFIVGDQRSGKPTGHEEMVINPTNAPLAVVPNKALKGMSRFAGNRYDEGTMSAGDVRPQELDAQPTGGFLNSLKEALGGFGDWQAGNREAMNSRLAGAGMPMENPMFNQAMGDAQMVAMGNVIKPTSINAAAIPKDWGPMEIQKYQQNIKMENLQTAKVMYENAIDRAERLGKLAEKAQGDRGMRLSRITDKAYSRINDIYQYTKELEDDILAGSRLRGARGSEAITNRTPGRSLTDSMEKALSGEDLTGYAEGTFAASTSLFQPKLTRGPAPTPYTEDLLLPYDSYTPQMSGDFITRSSAQTSYSPSSSGSLFPSSDVTQQQLIDLSRIATGPGGSSVLSGSMPSRFRIPGLQTPTAMQFNSLSGAERENLRPRLAAEFNSTLEDLMFDIEQRYSTSPSRLARFRG